MASLSRYVTDEIGGSLSVNRHLNDGAMTQEIRLYLASDRHGTDVVCHFRTGTRVKFVFDGRIGLVGPIELTLAHIERYRNAPEINNIRTAASRKFIFDGMVRNLGPNKMQ